MKEAHNLRLRQCAAGGVDGFADTVGDGVSGGPAEEEGGTGVAVVPYGEGSLEVRQADALQIPPLLRSSGRDDKGRGVAEVGVVSGMGKTAGVSSSSKNLIWTALEAL
jgi:hypothetical protein